MSTNKLEQNAFSPGWPSFLAPAQNNINYHESHLAKIFGKQPNLTKQFCISFLCNWRHGMIIKCISEKNGLTSVSLCVTIPKIWTKPNPNLFFRYQIFLILNPWFFSIPNISDTESSFFYTNFFSNTESDTILKIWKVLKPKCDTLLACRELHSSNNVAELSGQLFPSFMIWLDGFLSSLSSWLPGFLLLHNYCSNGEWWQNKRELSP